MTPVERSILWITGCGTVNALGPDVASFWDALLAGSCGIGPLDEALAGDTGVLGAAVHHPLPASKGGAPQSRADRMVLLAAEQAIRGSGLSDIGDRSRIAVIVGSTTGGFREIEDHFIGRVRGRFDPRRELLLLEKAGSADLIAARFGLSGPRYTVNTACASGASAILIGAGLIRAGLADAAVAGGVDALARLTVSGFRALRLVDPSPCRPFDRIRHGLSLGEGAGIVLIERQETAAARGVRPVAEFLGGGQSSDASHLTAPAVDGAGAARALRAALEEARVPPGATVHVNAHGTGTPANDAAEAAALHAALDGRVGACPVTSIKGAIGHTLGAAGAIEAIAAIQTLRTGAIPPTVGFVEPDPALGLDVVKGAPRRGDWRIALSNSFGFGGANAVLCFGKAGA